MGALIQQNGQMEQEKIDTLSGNSVARENDNPNSFSVRGF